MALLTPMAKLISQLFGPLAVANLILKFYGTFKIPLIGFLRPKVREFSQNRLVVTIPLRRRAKNHLGSMYFGSLATGADLAGGVVALNVIFREKAPVNFVFKDIHGEFLKRVESEAHFVCTDVQKVTDAVVAAANSEERVNVQFDVIVYAPAKLGEEPAAKFKLTLSLKKKSQKKA